ncbi:hypothetical protein [Actinokineospora fastidiosa]|uniref:hypothetical protein n=1 Tax=Actinokineospora fastidiosa TaxID=1816 RepID=UPI0016709747|nr:hypothetical protein [Actinokineospora fastidiosa]
MTPEHESLLTALVEFVGEAGKRAPELADMADREAADAMASWPQAGEVRQAAAVAAHTHGYLDEGQPAGRAFDAQGLNRLGIAGLLRAGREFDREALVNQLAGYFAGPAERIWRHLVLDLDWELPVPVEIVGWRLWRPNGEEWDELRPVPAAADYAAGQVWDPLLRFGEHVVLSVSEEQEEPANGHRIRLLAVSFLRVMPSWVATARVASVVVGQRRRSWSHR